MSEELYLVPYASKVIVEQLADTYPFPTSSELEAQIPEVFRLSGALNHLDYTVMKALNENGREYYALAQMVNAQNDKINTIISFILAEHEPKDNSYLTYALSGRALELKVLLPNSFKLHQKLRLKLFLVDYALAIYCYGVVEYIKDFKEVKNLELNQNLEKKQNHNKAKDTAKEIETEKTTSLFSAIRSMLAKKDLIIQNEEACKNEQVLSANNLLEETPPTSKEAALPKIEADNNYQLIGISFTQIREQDVDSLVKTTFAIQSRKLKERSLAKMVNKV